MKYQSNTNNNISGKYAIGSLRNRETTVEFKNTEEFKNFFQQYRLPDFDDLLTKLAAPAEKKSFLVFKNNKL
jgi:two-component system response regulator LytT